MQKTSAAPVTAWLIIRNGKIGIRLDPNQQLGKSCHAINDALLPGAAKSRQEWTDAPKPPPDVRQQQQVKTQRY
jgi:hypothetical protein